MANNGWIVSALVWMPLLSGCPAQTAQRLGSVSQTRPAAAAPFAPATLPVAELPEAPETALRPVMQILTSHYTVETYRISPEHGEDTSAGIVGYPILLRGPNLDPAAARQLVALVRDPRGYNGDVWCGPIKPGVAFRFVSEGHMVTILVCFKCEEWQFWLDRERVGGDTFFGIQRELLKLCQRIFPADEALRAIQPSEKYGRIYWIDELVQAPRKLTVDQREALAENWKQKVIDTVGEAADWQENGGGKHSLRMTRDGAGMIVLSTDKGHAAIGAVHGLTAAPAGN